MKKTLLDQPISIIILIFAFVLLFVSVRYFYVGLFNIDVGHNLGITQIQIAYSLMFFVGILFTIGIINIPTSNTRIKK